MLKIKVSALAALLMLTGGCIRNVYRDTFSPSKGVLPEPEGSGEVTMRMADPDSVRQLVADAMSEGWVVVGQSGFNGTLLNRTTGRSSLYGSYDYVTDVAGLSEGAA